jgi:hypothetical protein
LVIWLTKLLSIDSTEEEATKIIEPAEEPIYGLEAGSEFKQKFMALSLERGPLSRGYSIGTFFQSARRRILWGPDRNTPLRTNLSKDEAKMSEPPARSLLYERGVGYT